MEDAKEEEAMEEKTKAKEPSEAGKGRPYKLSCGFPKERSLGKGDMGGGSS